MKLPSFRTLSTLLILASCASLIAADRPAPSPDVQRAVQQFREFYLESARGFTMRDTNEPRPGPAQGRQFAAKLRADGSWPDIDYLADARSGWPPATHYTRMTAMAAAAGQRETAPNDRAVFLAATHRAFSWWIAHDYQCPNWWYNEIGTPKDIGLCAVLLGDDLTADEYRYATGTSLARFKIGRTGQNKVWLAGNTLMLGLLTANPQTIQEAAEAIWSEVRVSTDEGIQPDFSFHQHGAQQQFGNYGMAFAVETARWAGILRETPWQLPPAKLDVFTRYLLEGENWVCWRGAMDISACGRQFMPHSPRSKAATMAHVMTQAAFFDPAQNADYRAFVARNQPVAPNDLTGDKYFWRSDYLIHRTPEFAATLKMSSKRVIGAELVNSENLSGYHIADGALYLYRTGDEYEDIFPVWDWRKLPGVTCAQTPLPSYKTSFVDRDFVGGISDGVDGAAALDYVRDRVRAKKAWFFSGDVIVCLGTDISGHLPAGIATTLNQCLLRGPVRVEIAGSQTPLVVGHQTLTEASAVEHDGWRYTMLEKNALHVDTGPVKGNWHRVFNNPDSPKADVTENVFTLWIDHGAEAKGASYAYSVTPLLPSVTPRDVRVIENSAARQAVWLPGAKAAIVFWAPGEIALPDGRRIAADQPCLVLTDAKSTRVVDPTQKQRQIHLRIDSVDRTVVLPTGSIAGTASVVR